MAHAVKDDKKPVEGSENSAGKEHLRDFLKKERRMSRKGRKIKDDSKAGGRKNIRKGRIIEINFQKMGILHLQKTLWHPHEGGKRRYASSEQQLEGSY